jgi:vitellogenic carboxypeptidase-like protein
LALREAGPPSPSETPADHFQPPSNSSYWSLPLAGALIGDGLTDPGLQELTKPRAAYDLGLIDLGTMSSAQSHAEKAWSKVQSHDYLGAKVERELMEGAVSEASGVNLYDVRRFEPYDTSREAAWLDLPETKAMLGVPVGRDFGTNDNVAEAMSGDVMKSYKGDVKTLLEEGIPVLLYQGQFDWKDGASSNEAWVATLGVESYLNATRRIMYRDGEEGKRVPYGWIKGSGILKDAVVQNAGHMVPMDQPLAAYDMMAKFVRGKL